MSIEWEKLREPFPAADVEWRLQTCGKKGDKVWALCLAYITNRAIMQRLDDVLTPAGWQNRFETGPHGGVICGISVKVGDEWITKWDGAENTQVEAVKGGLSDAMKRAGYQWGIGRYLYNLEEGFAKVHDGGAYRGRTKDNVDFKWDPPALPAWALPAGTPPKAPNRPQEKPQPPNGAGTTTATDTPAQKLLTELAEFCGGVEDMMNAALIEHSTFNGNNGPVWLTLEKLKTTPKPGTEKRFETWCNKTRDSIKKSKESAKAEMCAECRQPIVNNTCACAPFA